jgi:CreA protein
MNHSVLGKLAGSALWLLATAVDAQEIGSVDTTFQWLGPNHKIVIEAFDDPKIDGVTCYVSRSKTGGVKGGLGLAEDTSDASLACRQTGPINVKEKFKDGEEVFTESRSLLFKKMRVVRFLDKPRNTLVYLVYSDKLVEGSPKKLAFSSRDDAMGQSAAQGDALMPGT